MTNGHETTLLKMELHVLQRKTWWQATIVWYIVSVGQPWLLWTYHGHLDSLHQGRLCLKVILDYRIDTKQITLATTSVCQVEEGNHTLPHIILWVMLDCYIYYVKEHIVIVIIIITM